MAAFEEILQLEQSLSELQASIPKARQELEGMDKVIEKARDKVQETRHAFTAVTANLKHLREVADHVVLDEWKHMVGVRDEAREDLVEAQQALAKAEDRKRKLNEHLASMEGAVDARKHALAQYGQLRQFPTKAG